MPEGVEGVVGSMFAILSGEVQDAQQQEQLLNYMVTTMPEDLRAAVVQQDESAIMSICSPVFLREPDLQAWILEPANMEAVRQFIPHLIPRIHQMAEYQMAEAQQHSQPEQPPQEPPPGELPEGGPSMIEGTAVDDDEDYGL